MKIHNKIEVKIGERATFKAYNTLLDSALEAFESLSPYASKIAYGTGTSPTQRTMTTLENHHGTLDIQLTSSNFSPIGGDIFAEYSAVLEASDPRELAFSEVGLCFGDNTTEDGVPIIVDRFLMKNEAGQVETITRRPHEEMVIVVTLYLEVSGSSALKPPGNDNPFFARLLGSDFGYKEGEELIVRTGECLFETSSMVIRPAGDLHPSYKQINDFHIENGVLTFCLKAGFEKKPQKETVVLFAGVPVLRVNNLDFSSTVEGSGTYVADGNKEVLVDAEYILSVDLVEDVSASGAIMTNYKVEKYGLRCGTADDVPFGDVDYRYLPDKYYSTDGKYLAFKVDSRLDAFKTYLSTFKRLDTTEVDVIHSVDVKIVGDIMLVRSFTSERGYWTDYYRLEGEKYIKGSINCDFVSFSGQIFKDFDINFTNSHNTYAVMVGLEGLTIYGTLIRNDEDNTLTGGVYVTSENEVVGVAVVSGSNITDACGIGYMANGNTLVCRNFTFVIRENVTTTRLFLGERVDKWSPKKFNGWLCGVDNTLTSSAVPMAYFYDPVNNVETTFSGPSLSRKVFLSQDLRTMFVVPRAGGVKGYYLDYDKTPHAFKATPPSTIVSSRSTDIQIVDNILLIVGSLATDALRAVPLLCDFVRLSPLRSGDEFRVSYTTAVYPGVNQNNIADVDIDISV